MQRFDVHPTHPQKRLLKQAVTMLHAGELVVFPTDTTYVLACHAGDKSALEKLIALRRLAKQHHFTLLCRDLSELATYARVDNPVYRYLKHYTPGPFTFILPATREVPRRLVHEKRRTIGIRVPDHPVAQALLEEMGEPVMTSTLRMPDDEYPLSDTDEICERLGGRVAAVLDCGNGGLEPSTLVDLVSHEPVLVRQGLGVLED